MISGPAYSHEEWSAGFWPGGGAVPGPAYYAYAVPKPAGLEGAAVRPAAASGTRSSAEFILMYDDVRAADSPEDACTRSWRAPTRPARLSASGTAPRWRFDEMPACKHIDQIKITHTDKKGCEECLKMGDTWVHLRLCLSAGTSGAAIPRRTSTPRSIFMRRSIRWCAPSSRARPGCGVTWMKSCRATWTAYSHRRMSLN